jgi:hypothetical protein
MRLFTEWAIVVVITNDERSMAGIPATTALVAWAIAAA